MINFESLKEVETTNPRANYDLRFSAKTGKFTISSEAFNRLDIHNNGFTLHSDGENVVLAVRPSDRSTILRGRDNGKDKGNVFSAKALIRMLNLTEDAEFIFNEVEHEDITYITLERTGEAPIEEVPNEAEESDSPFASDHY